MESNSTLPEGPDSIVSTIRNYGLTDYVLIRNDYLLTCNAEDNCKLQLSFCFERALSFCIDLLLSSIADTRKYPNVHHANVADWTLSETSEHQRAKLLLHNP